MADEHVTGPGRSLDKEELKKRFKEWVLSINKKFSKRDKNFSTTLEDEPKYEYIPLTPIQAGNWLVENAFNSAAFGILKSITGRNRVKGWLGQRSDRPNEKNEYFCKCYEQYQEALGIGFSRMAIEGDIDWKKYSCLMYLYLKEKVVPPATEESSANTVGASIVALLQEYHLLSREEKQAKPEQFLATEEKPLTLASHPAGCPQEGKETQDAQGLTASSKVPLSEHVCSDNKPS